MKKQVNGMKLLHGSATVLALIVFGNCIAIDIVDEKKDIPKVTIHGDVAVVDMPDGSEYTVAAVPLEANSMKTFIEIPAEFKKDKFKKSLGMMSLSGQVTRDEAVRVLDGYLHEVAFDYDSVKLRKLVVSDPQYAAWCDNYMFTCLSWQFRAGTWVEYEINGKNRGGGMTGFQRNVVLIRRAVAATTTPPPPTDSPPITK
jgi:hypothetical protein